MAIDVSRGASPIIHCDLVSHGFKHKLDAAGMTQSISQVGKCTVSGPMGAFGESSNAKNITYTNIIHMRISIMQLMNISTSIIPRDYKKD